MFEYRQVLTRMRLGDTDRAIARAGLMGRRKAAQLRLTAEASLCARLGVSDEQLDAARQGADRRRPHRL